MRTKRIWPYFFGSELADSGVRAVNAYGWGVADIWNTQGFYFSAW